MATKTIKKVVTKPAVTTPTVSTDPNAIYQQLAQMPQGGATPFDQTYNDAANKYRTASNATYVLPDVLKSYLGQVSPQYTQDKSAVLAQFADKNSPLYISNPFARLQAAQAAQTGQAQTYSQVLDRVNRLVGMGVAQQQQNVSDLGAQVTSAQQAQKDQRAALQQQFSNALSIASNNRANANGAATPKYTIKQQQGWIDPITQLPNSKVQPGMQFLKDGIPVSPSEFAQGTNTSLMNLLSSSPSQADQGYAQELAGIMQSGDTAGAQTFREQHPWLFGDIVAK